MTGLDHKRSGISVRELFAVTRAKAGKIAAGIKAGGAGGCVVLSTCNRTELYATIPEDADFAPSEALCAALNIDFSEYGPHLTERTGDAVMEHLCRVACGLNSQIIGDDQIITQVREALELSRSLHCTDSYIETMFNLSIRTAKVVKTEIFINSLKTSTVPEHTVDKLKSMQNLSGQNALVIGNGRIGRQVCELLTRENTNVTVTLRSHNRNNVKIPDNVDTINYEERYKIVEKSNIVISATTSPHITVSKNELISLRKLPTIFVDLAVPRDIEPSVGGINGVTLLTIDDISSNGQHLPPESVLQAENIIAEHIAKYNKWYLYKKMFEFTAVPYD